MTFVEARNAIVEGLEKYLGCPVDLSDQIAPKSEPPYCYYSVLAPRIQRNTLGLNETIVGEDTRILRRSEPVSATMSFTFCGENRQTEEGYIYGEDEALALAEKAHSYFLLVAHNISTEAGDIVIRRVGNVANRSAFLVDDTIRRYGFDVRFNYVRTDEMPTTTILKPGIPKGEPHS